MEQAILCLHNGTAARYMAHYIVHSDHVRRNKLLCLTNDLQITKSKWKRVKRVQRNCTQAVQLYKCDGSFAFRSNNVVNTTITSSWITVAQTLAGMQQCTHIM